jgi:hypothetical protein
MLLDRESQFITSGGVRLYCCCPSNALGAALRRASQDNAYSTLYVYTLMRSHKDAKGNPLCKAQGNANGSALLLAANVAGFKGIYSGLHEPWTTWSDFVQLHGVQGGKPLVLEVSLGQKLVDSISGKGENAKDLHYHFIALLAYHPDGYSQRAGRILPTGWWCADGANLASGNALQFYPESVLAAAVPCAALAIIPKVAALPAIEPMAKPVAPPASQPATKPQPPVAVVTTTATSSAITTPFPTPTPASDQATDQATDQSAKLRAALVSISQTVQAALGLG